MNKHIKQLDTHKHTCWTAAAHNIRTLTCQWRCR